MLLFILPWQTRFIYEQAFINGAPWEYGTKSLYGTELLLGLLIFCGIILLVRQKKFWSAQVRKSTYWLSVAVLSGLVACVIAGSVRPDISFDFFTRLLLCASLMVLIAARVVPITRYQVLAAFWLGGVLQGALALHQFFTQQVFANKWLGMAGHSAQELGASVVEFGGERWLRAYGSFGSPNSLGIYLAVIVVLGIILYAGSDSRKIKLGITVGQLIIVSGLILSFSRGAWIAAGAGFLILGYRIWGTEQRMGFIKQIMLYLSISLFFIFTLQPLFFARFTPANRLESRSINERSSQIIEATQSIKKHPLLGVGPGAYTAALATLHPKVAAWELQPVHTIYLLFVAEWGIPASLIMGIVYLLLLKKVWRSKTPYVAVLAVLGVAGLFDHWVYSMFTGQLLWFVVWGIAVKAESGKDLIV